MNTSDYKKAAQELRVFRMETSQSKAVSELRRMHIAFQNIRAALNESSITLNQVAEAAHRVNLIARAGS